MKLYHGTTVSQIERLRCNSKHHAGNPVLYLTDNRAYSLFYIRDREIDFVTCGVGEDGKVYYDEKFPDQLKTLYEGRSGYIYETDVSAEKYHVRGIWVCSRDARITGMEFIPDVYQVILHEIEKGNVVLLPYESLTEEQKQMNYRGVVDYLRRGQLSHAKAQFFRNHFPEAWGETR